MPEGPGPDESAVEAIGILGIDKFMSGARVITNHIGNGIAAVVTASEAE